MKLKFNLLGTNLGEYDITPVEPYLKSLPRLIRAFTVGMMHPKVSGWLKLYAIAGIIYFFSPLDIVPDFVTGIGFVDDTILALLIMQLFLRNLDAELLERILGGDPKQLIFFNVKDGLAAFRETFGGIYQKVMARYQELAEKYQQAVPCVPAVEEQAQDD